MPIYEYRCKACEKTFSRIQKMDAGSEGVKSPKCESEKVERLLGAFSGELEKLDEVLEVLAAYAQRMRAQPRRKSRHTLH